MARAWYAYDGMGSPFLTSSYNLSVIKPTCINGCKVCAIYELNGGSTPQLLSANIRNYIIFMMISSVAQPSDPGAKIYLYSKNC
ncbi:hypothetical protein HDE69_001692 [Pedobacter cryoconitis]|uniref:Uncharacterized protein n=1 Tax=Pedobacter cryoconitis TaxID=188932 RepID=A0A7W8YRU1_9SPHI|nr:hypothetical protein [Pedobacter cryoconitis]